ncbi:MAG: methionine--tRNA ligase [Candidatus Paceibacterota bacterium]|jgi:methionyl-tRNA synthetase
MKKLFVTTCKNRILITTPIYYVNDKPHIGHAYTILAADVLARFFRDQGKEVFFLTGTDEHGSKIAESAEKIGKSPKQLCDENSQLYKDAWKNLNIKYDYFIRTTDKKHEEVVKKFVEQLKERGAIYERDYEGLYCNGCEKFLTSKELVDGLCPYHKTKPQKISEKNYFFRLTNYLKEVETAIIDNKLKIQPLSAKQEILGLFKQNLDDFSISRQKEKVKWAIEVPFDNKQTIYVWVDALVNYISAMGYGSNMKEFKKWWENAYIIHLLGRDILKFHAIYWPAMLIAGGIKLPDQESIHGLFTINGQKMSKTIGNVIDPNKLVDKFGDDVTRYLLLSQFPFGKDGNIQEVKFEEQYNFDLAQGLGNLVSRILALGEQYGKSITLQCSVPGLMTKSWDDYKKYMEEFCFNDALATIWALMSYCDKYISEAKPWEKINNEKEFQKILGELIYILANIALMLSSVMPQTSEKILKFLKLQDISKQDWLSQKVQLEKQVPLFPKKV